MCRSAVVLSLVLGVTIGCSREGGKVDQMTGANPVGAGGRVKITGCLTGAPDRAAFVVTADRNALVSGALYSGSGEVPTYTYELVGGNGVAALVGRQVEVQGRLDEDMDKEVDVEAKSQTELPAARSGNDTVTPAIETNEEIEIKVRRVHVDSIAPTGAPCR